MKELIKLEEALNQRFETLKDLIGDENFARRFIKVVLNYSYQNPKIFETTPASIIASIYEIAQLRLDIGNGQSYLVPYGNITKPIIGYQGYITLLYRTGLFKVIYANLVYEKDEIFIQYGSEQKLLHIPKYESENVIGGYAYAKLTSGGEVFEYLPLKELEKRRKLSKVPSSFAWSEFRDEMYRKSCVRAIAKWLPKSEADPLILKAIQIDDASSFNALKLDKMNERYIIDYDKLKSEENKEKIINQAVELIENKSKKKRKNEDVSLFDEDKNEEIH